MINRWTNNLDAGVPELSIVVVNWNGRDFVLDCLNSIVQNPASVTFEVIVVDNDSADTSVELIKSWALDNKSSVRLTLIQSAENLGFGNANNLAFANSSSEFVLILNPDTIVKPKALDRMIESMKMDSKIGFVGPKLLNADGTLQASVWRHPPTAATILFEGLKLYRLLPKRLRGNLLLSYHWSHDERRQVPAISGAVMLARRKMIDEIGGFAEEIHMYGEDAEFCVRAARNGWSLVFEPTAEIVHLGGQSAVQRWGENERHVIEEKAWAEFQAKYQTRPRALATLSARVLLLLLYLAKQSLMGNDTVLLRKLIGMQFRSIRFVLGTGRT